jgi:cyclopropane-fatty-acyl-phospholipid synthase
MSTAEGTIRREPAAAGSLLGRAAIAVLDRLLPELEDGTLLVELPDGSTRRFGSGPEVGMRVHSDKLFRRLATRPRLGLGESYQAGEWYSDDLVGFFELLLRNVGAASARHVGWRRFTSARPRLARRNSFLGARRNIQYHYDLGNDLFRLFLDDTLTYSCAIFESPDEPLEVAQLRKLRAICDKLRLGPDDRVLEIGCGWGSFALVAAGEYGAEVTGLTLSPAQAQVARERAAEAGLSDRIEILEEDYRTHDGAYTRVASIEMIEAIGEKQFPTYFETVDRLLEPGGAACIQSILVPDDRYDRYRTSPDWIERYVFPGCLIPSLSALTGAMTSSSRLMVHELEEIGPSYAETLRRWRERFLANLDEVRKLGYDTRFERTWDFYLAFCEAAFRTRALRDVQLVLTRPFDESVPA